MGRNWDDGNPKPTTCKPRSVPTPKQIKAHLDSTVVGQDAAKRKLSVAVSGHYARSFGALGGIDDPKLADVKIEKSNVLLLGPTGCGKTHLVKGVAEILEVPHAVADATAFTQAGYYGLDVESVLNDLLRAADNDIRKAQHGIVYIDEIDKTRKVPGTIGVDVGGEGVQQALLKMIEGSMCHLTDKNDPCSGTTSPILDTTDVLFICGGAFVGLDHIVAKRLPNRGDEELLGQVMPYDLVQYGIIPELAGRLPVVAAVSALTEEDLQAILTKPKNALLKQFKKLCNTQGYDIGFTEDAVRAMATVAMRMQTGARALRAVVEEVLLDIRFNGEKGHRYIVDADVVYGKKSPKAQNL